MRYYLVTWSQALLISVMSAILSAGTVYATSMFLHISQLPIVEVDTAGKCVRVISKKNGEAFQCQDKDVLLREYTIKVPVIEVKTEK